MEMSCIKLQLFSQWHFHNYRWFLISCEVKQQNFFRTLMNSRYIGVTLFTQICYNRTVCVCTWFVPKVSVLIFLCTNWQHSTSLMYIGTLVVTLAACPYLFQLDGLSQSCATVGCVWSCFLTSLRLRCRKISNNGKL